MPKKMSFQVLLWLALVLALVGSLRHVAWGFSTLEQGDLIAGYVQAVAVDIGLFSLAVGIQQRRKDNRSTRGLWVGVILFSAVSTYANLLHGLYFQSDLGLAGWGWLVVARPFILSAVLPALVVYLSEVAASDYQHSVKVAAREARKAERASVREPSDLGNLDTANAARVDGKQHAMDNLLTFYQANPDASLAEAGRAIGRSKTTVGTYLDELQEQGVVSRNGHGVQVVEG